MGSGEIIGKWGDYWEVGGVGGKLLETVSSSLSYLQLIGDLSFYNYSPC